MKIRPGGSIGTIVVTVTVLSGCAHQKVDSGYRPPSTVPPAPKVETMSPAPGPDYVWLPGGWTFKERHIPLLGKRAHWEWVPGHWAVACQVPKSGA